MAVSTIKNHSFVTETKTVNISHTGAGIVDYSESIAKSGYKPLALAGWYINRSDVIPTSIIVDNSQETVRGRVSKTSSGSATTHLFVRIVYEPS